MTNPENARPAALAMAMPPMAPPDREECFGVEVGAVPALALVCVEMDDVVLKVELHCVNAEDFIIWPQVHELHRVRLSAVAISLNGTYMYL